MAKTIETEVPDWARWKTKDKNGTICIFADEPIAGVDQWFHENGNCWVIGRGDPCEDDSWKQELYRI